MRPWTQRHRSGVGAVATALAMSAALLTAGAASTAVAAPDGTGAGASGPDRAARVDIRLTVNQPPQIGAAPGSKKTVRVSVQNLGDNAVRGTRVRISSPPGVSVSPTSAELPLIPLYETRKAAFTVRLKAGKARRLTITASVPDKAKRSRSLVVSPQAGAVSRSLVGSYHWGTIFNPTSIWRNTGIYFATPKLAYVGFPPKGLPRCRKAGGRCVRYSFSPRTHKIRVGSEKGTYRQGRLTLDGQSYDPLKVPPEGAGWNVTLVQLGLEGCEPSGPCLTFTHRLQLTEKGRFSALTTSIATRVAGYRAATARKPDQSFVRDGSGRYSVGPRGQLTLRYGDGRVERTTVGVITDGRRRPDPYRAGLLVGHTNYYYETGYYPGQG